MNSSFNRTVCLLGISLLLGGCATVATEPRTDIPPSSLHNTSRPEAIEFTAPVTPAPQPEAVASPAPPADFWQQVREGFRLPDKQHKRVTRQSARYASSPTHVERVFRRGEPYLAYIQDEVAQRGFPSEITLLPFIESGYDPFAYSHGRAAGLWQFIPGTGRMYGLEQDWWHDERRDVVASTRAALDYLDYLQQTFDGDWLLALAAYNAGSGTVRKAIRRNREAGKPVDFWHLDLPRETSAYVPKLLAISRIVEQPATYGIALHPVDTNPDFAIVETGGQLDIAVAAELASLEVEELYALNPSYNRWATHPEGPHRLLLPADRADVFSANLDALPDSQRMKWVRHKVRSGETLSHIAQRYNTRVSVVRQTNNLDSDRIRAGRHLLVPVAAKDASRYVAAGRSPRTAGPAKQSIHYKVRTGDSLWKIARRHEVSIAELSRWNSLNRDAVIRPGQKLVIRRGTSGTPDDTRVRTVRYTVRKGDSLFLISRKFNVSIADLRDWNDLNGKKYLQPGQQLKVKVDVTKQSVASRG